MTTATCVAAVLDADKRPRLCGRPATTARMIDGTTYPVCADCAAAPVEGRPATKRDRAPMATSSPADVAAWARAARGLARDIRELAEDATAPRGERRQSRTFLRKMICRRLRDLDAKIDALATSTSSDTPAD